MKELLPNLDKPFNVNTFSTEKRYCTRTGNPVVISIVDGTGARPIKGYIRYPNGDSPSSWHNNGMYHVCITGGTSNEDVFEAKVAVTKYTNVYGDKDYYRFGSLIQNKDHLEAARSDSMQYPWIGTAELTLFL